MAIAERTRGEARRKVNRALNKLLYPYLTRRADDDVVFLEEVCAVEDADALLMEIQAGTAVLDWSGCTYLHTACLQLILAARLKVRGVPGDAVLARWVLPLLAPYAAAALPAGPEKPILMEV